MAYITTEEVAAKRTAIKESFPTKEGWKFSVRRENHSTIVVTILEAPLSFAEALKDQEYRSVSEYHYKNTFQGVELEAISKIMDIIQEGNHDNSDTMTDYFDVGFYISLFIGQYDKPFKFNKEKSINNKTQEEMKKSTYSEVISEEATLEENAQITFSKVNNTSEEEQEYMNFIRTQFFMNFEEIVMDSMLEGEVSEHRATINQEKALVRTIKEILENAVIFHTNGFKINHQVCITFLALTDIISQVSKEFEISKGALIESVVRQAKNQSIVSVVIEKEEPVQPAKEKKKPRLKKTAPKAIETEEPTNHKEELVKVPETGQNEAKVIKIDVQSMIEELYSKEEPVQPAKEKKKPRLKKTAPKAIETEELTNHKEELVKVPETGQNEAKEGIIYKLAFKKAKDLDGSLKSIEIDQEETNKLNSISTFEDLKNIFDNLKDNYRFIPKSKSILSNSFEKIEDRVFIGKNRMFIKDLHKKFEGIPASVTNIEELKEFVEASELNSFFKGGQEFVFGKDITIHPDSFILTDSKGKRIVGSRLYNITSNMLIVKLG